MRLYYQSDSGLSTSLTVWPAWLKLPGVRNLNQGTIPYLKTTHEEDLMTDEVFETIKEIINELLDIDDEEITMEARFREDLEADSLDLVELIMEFEERFGGEISDEDAQKITTVGEAVNYVKTRM
jgi:acyl carrier protein